MQALTHARVHDPDSRIRHDRVMNPNFEDDDLGDPVLVVNEFVGYGESPIPESRDFEVDEYLRTRIARAKKTGLPLPTGDEDPTTRPYPYGAYARRAASRAVRRRDSELLTLGLVGVAIISRTKNDPRDCLFGFPPLEDACHRLGLDPHVVFRSAATYVSKPGGRELEDWLKRPALSRRIDKWRVTAQGEGSSFAYVRDHNPAPLLPRETR